MKEAYYVYNNEAIACCIFLSILNNEKTIDVARASLILPFLLDDRFVNYLVKNNVLDIKQLIDDRPKYFISFNRKYMALLPITINSLMILYKSNEISIQNSQIIRKSNLMFPSDIMGERFSKINFVIPHFLMMINQYETSELYNILNIQL